MLSFVWALSWNLSGFVEPAEGWGPHRYSLWGSLNHTSYPTMTRYHEIQIKKQKIVNKNVNFQRDKWTLARDLLQEFYLQHRDCKMRKVLAVFEIKRRKIIRKKNNFPSDRIFPHTICPLKMSSQMSWCQQTSGQIWASASSSRFPPSLHPDRLKFFSRVFVHQCEMQILNGNSKQNYGYTIWKFSADTIQPISDTDINKPHMHIALLLL